MFSSVIVLHMFEVYIDNLIAELCAARFLLLMGIRLASPSTSDCSSVLSELSTSALFQFGGASVIISPNHLVTIHLSPGDCIVVLRKLDIKIRVIRKKKNPKSN